MITDLPNKIGTTIVFDLTVYFMTNLRRTPGHFFVFFLFTFVCTVTMSMFFRSIGALSRSLSQAMAPAAIFILALVIYTGFAIPVTNMHPWFRWLNYLDPVAYAFEALMINEVGAVASFGMINLLIFTLVLWSENQLFPIYTLCGCQSS